MNRIELREWLLNNAFDKKGNKITNWAFKNHSEILDILKTYTSFFTSDVSPTVRIHAFLKGQDELIKCAFCSKHIPPDKYGEQRIYCSKRCASSSPERRIHIANTSLERYGNSNVNAVQSIKDKIKKTNLERYGVNSPTQVDYIKEKMLNNTKSTCMSRYGVDSSFKIPEVKEKIKQTLLERYGVDHPLKNEVIKNKIKQTNLERYGVENILSHIDIREKIRQTNLERYGVENVGQCEDVKDRIRKTFIDNYGVDHPLKNKEIRDKIKQTNLERYGVDNASKLDHVKEKTRSTCINRYGSDSFISNPLDPDTLIRLQDLAWLEEQYNLYGVQYIADHLNLAVMTVYRYLNKAGVQLNDKWGTSAVERQLLSFIKEVYLGEIIINDRTLISPYEIDLYIPELKLALEYNGVYWHTEQMGKNYKYHLHKTTECAKRDIQLLHIFSSDDFDIWKSVILSKMNISFRSVGARSTICKSVDLAEVKTFLKDNHLQGSVNSSINYGLYHLDELLSVMTFGKPRFNKHYEWELLRYCCKKNTRVIGGASKLLKNANLSSIVSYANIRWSDGNLYEKLGFKLIGISKPNYFYTRDGLTLESRNRFQKHLLKDRFEIYDAHLTEYENMLNNGYDRIWDCGNLVYAKE